MKIVVVLEPCEGGGYTAHIPSLPGCISEGESIEAALGNIREAFETLIEPTDDDLIVGEHELVEALTLDWAQIESPHPAPDREPEPPMTAERSASSSAGPGSYVTTRPLRALRLDTLENPPNPEGEDS